METLQIMPAVAQNQSRFNLGEYAEEAILVEEVAVPKRVNHFIEANTQEVTSALTTGLHHSQLCINGRDH